MNITGRTPSGQQVHYLDEIQVGSRWIAGKLEPVSTYRLHCGTVNTKHINRHIRARVTGEPVTCAKCQALTPAGDITNG